MGLQLVPSQSTLWLAPWSLPDPGDWDPREQDGHSLVSLRAEACSLVVLGAVDVRTVVEGAVPTTDGPAATLVHKVPVEAGIGPMLCAFVLYKKWALFCAELLQVPAKTVHVGRPGMESEVPCFPA